MVLTAEFRISAHNISPRSHPGAAVLRSGIFGFRGGPVIGTGRRGADGHGDNPPTSCRTLAASGSGYPEKMNPTVVRATDGLSIHAEILEYQGRYYPSARLRVSDGACTAEARLAMPRKFE